MDLQSFEAPYIYLNVLSEADFTQFAYRLNYEKSSRWVIRVLRGTKMRTLDGLFDEFAAAMQFPAYFGENWAAFDECLSDLEWLPASAYVLLITRAREVLSLEPDSQLEVLIRILTEICEHWAQKRPPRPCHVLMQCAESDVENLVRRMKDCSNRTLPIAYGIQYD